ncbi:MAG: SGNH/GDSL hydrolase family protein [Gemmatimonadetes bacterium]|nr:SGNH/GDSL hydrolase family protein [Gemmatimonadota bacterium]
MSRQLFQYHPTFAYQYVPGLKARLEGDGGPYLLRVNQAGFRCAHEFTPTKSPDRFRVLLFGDSYTAGDGVSDRDRYGDLLEGLLPGVEVFNFALSGTGTDQQYLIFREAARGIEHDLVVVGVMVENIRRIVARYREYLSSTTGERLLHAKPYFTLEGGELRLHNVPVPEKPVRLDELPPEERPYVDLGGRFRRLRDWVRRMGWTDTLQRLTRYQALPAYNRAGSPDWLLMKAILTRWASEATAPVMIMPIPLPAYVEETSSPRRYQKRFRELAALPNVTVHDPLPHLRRVPRAERRALRFPNDVHPTAAAHRVLAQSLAEAVQPFVTRGTNLT